MDNLIKVGVGGKLSTQSITSDDVLLNGRYSETDVTFTFDELKEVVGITNIEKTWRYNAKTQFVQYFTISGNTVTLRIVNHYDSDISCYKWTVTAIGK